MFSTFTIGTGGLYFWFSLVLDLSNPTSYLLPSCFTFLSIKWEKKEGRLVRWALETHGTYVGMCPKHITLTLTKVLRTLIKDI